MMKTEKLLKKEIIKARRILVLSHKGPDVDAFCSMLLIYKILTDIFPDKEVVVKARQYPNVKLPLMKKINIVEDGEALEPEGEDLIIVTDSSVWRMCTDDQDTIQNSTAPTFFIDHHRTDPETTEIGNSHYINEMRSSATEQVYVSLRRIFGKKLKLDKDVASLVQYGIVADTGRFLFDLTPETFRIFAEAVEVHRVDLVEFEYKSTKFPREATNVIIEYLRSLTIEGDMSYMYISENTIRDNNFKKHSVNEAFVFLRDRYLRFIQGVHWGFIVKPMLGDDGKWTVSFRSTKGYQDVEEIATRLGGGGHKYSAATKLRADNIDEVLETVLAFVKEVVS
jgi:nanoRNase/pAp phosphatase (c-di-AMP/oligoRNAs hydrolase)